MSVSVVIEFLRRNPLFATVPQRELDGLVAVTQTDAEREGAQTGAGLSLPFHLTRQNLADMTGTTVETTIRIVRRWLKDRLVVEEGGRFVLRDGAALRRMADSGKT